MSRRIFRECHPLWPHCVFYLACGPLVERARARAPLSILTTTNGLDSFKSKLTSRQQGNFAKWLPSITFPIPRVLPLCIQVYARHIGIAGCHSPDPTEPNVATSLTHTRPHSHPNLGDATERERCIKYSLYRPLAIRLAAENAIWAQFGPLLRPKSRLM